MLGSHRANMHRPALLNHSVRRGQMVDRDDLLKRLVDVLYERNDVSFARGRFRVRGDVVEIYPATADEEAIRLEFFGDDIDAIRLIVSAWIKDPGIDAVITTGGTGFTGRDVTPEAVEPLFEKRMDGFSIAFHLLSHAKIGASTIQSQGF